MKSRVVLPMNECSSAKGIQCCTYVCIHTFTHVIDTCLRCGLKLDITCAGLNA